MVGPRGKHLLVDVWGVPEHLCLSSTLLLQWMVEAAQKMGATVVDQRIHSLPSPPGVTGVVLLDESHISCHTYADRGWMAIDIFVCGEGKDPIIGWEYLKEQLGIEPNNYCWAVHSRFAGGPWDGQLSQEAGPERPA